MFISCTTELKPLPNFLRPVLGIALLTLTAQAYALGNDCNVDGKHINLDNGASTANLTGIVKCVEKDTGKPSREIPYVKGKLHGTEKSVSWMDGKTTLTEYREGKKHGTTRVYAKKGTLESETKYENDQETGPSRSFYPSGKIKRETEFADGKNERSMAISREFSEDGKLIGLRAGNGSGLGMPGRKYANYSGRLSIYYPNGTLREELSFKQGLFDGRQERYRPEGTLVSREEWKAGLLNGVAKSFQEDGKNPSREVHFSAGVYDGIEREFHRGMAQASAEREWRDGILEKERRFYQNGNVEQEVIRKGDEFIAKSFWDDGKAKSTGQYVSRRAGGRPMKQEASWFEPQLRAASSYGATLGTYWPDAVPNGLATTFYANGSRKSETDYRAGKREGAEKTWHDNGQLASEAQYKDGVLVARKEYNKEGALLRDEAFYPDGSRKLK